MFKYLILICMLLVTGCGKSETYLRARVAMLKSHQGLCSAEQVRAPSGKDYLLTAGHCRDIAADKDSMVTFDDGKGSYHPYVIAEDPYSDLLLLTGRKGMEGLAISKTESRQQHVRTFTHGAGHSTYKTEGEIIEDQQIKAPIFVITDEADEKRCHYKKQSVMSFETFFGPVKACVLTVVDIGSTAMIVPGSSGGMVVDDKGDLIGVASATNGPFSFFVKLKDIQRFLKRR